MKRIYLLLILSMATAASSFAQRNCDLTITAHGIGTTTTTHSIATGEKILADAGGTSKYYFTFTIKNTGPDSLKAGDSLLIRSAYGTNYIFGFPTGQSLKKDSSISIYPSSGAVTLTPSSSVTSSSTNSSYQWCDSIWTKIPAANGTVTDPVGNNKLCTSVVLTFWVTGINTVTNNADGFILYPNPASGKLNVKFDFGASSKTQVVMRDVTGKVVLQKDMGTLSGNQEFSLDVSNLAQGMYTAELYYNEQHIISKVSVQ
ncbi:MAG: T9SS type A sorting domain-containing protein [Bacteroidetes bacterium]|nr:T9SS type A sorting domain-containing protein [Bacteroidota bacterium]